MDTREAPVSVEQVASEGIRAEKQRALRHEASRALQQENRLLGGTEET